MPKQDFLRFAMTDPFRLAALVTLGILITACGVTSQASPTAEFQPTAGPSTIVTEAATEIPLLEMTPLTLPSPTEKLEVIEGELALFYLRETYKDNITGWWIQLDSGEHGQYMFVNVYGNQVTVNTNNIAFDLANKIAVIYDDAGNPLYVRNLDENGVGGWVGVTEENAETHFIREKNLEGRHYDWNASTQNWEASIPYTDEQLDLAYGVGNWRFSESGNLELAKRNYDMSWDQSTWTTAIELAPEGGINVLFTDEAEKHHFEKEALSARTVNGVSTKEILTLQTGEGPVGVRMLVLEWQGSFAVPITFDNPLGIVQSNYDSIASGVAEMSGLLQLPEFPADAYPAQMRVMPLSGWEPGLKLSFDLGPFDKLTVDPGSDPSAALGSMEIEHPETQEKMKVVFYAVKLAGGEVLILPFGFTGGYLESGEMTWIQDAVLGPNRYRNLSVIVSTFTIQPGELDREQYHAPVTFAQPSLASLAGGATSLDVGQGWDALPGLMSKEDKQVWLDYATGLKKHNTTEEAWAFYDSYVRAVDPHMLGPLTRRVNFPAFENNRWVSAANANK